MIAAIEEAVQTAVAAALREAPKPAPAEASLLSVPDAAVALGYRAGNRAAMYRLIDAGLLHPVRIGQKRVMIPIEEVRALAERLRERG